MAQAMFGAGCFWGVEYNFSKVKGVNDVLSGYSGGKTQNPTYEQVCSNTTDHAEVVLVDYDANVVSYDTLLNVFWEKHDPTTLNRQGPDIGTQYRSAIFYFNDNQKKIAINSKKQFEIKNNLVAVTEVSKAKDFYIAEEYHQCFIKKKSIF